MTFFNLTPPAQVAVGNALSVSTNQIELVIVYIAGAGPTVYVPATLGHEPTSDTSIGLGAVASHIRTSSCGNTTCGTGKRKVVVARATTVVAACVGC